MVPSMKDRFDRREGGTRKLGWSPCNDTGSVCPMDLVFPGVYYCGHATARDKHLVECQDGNGHKCVYRL